MSFKFKIVQTHSIAANKNKSNMFLVRAGKLSPLVSSATENVQNEQQKLNDKLIITNQIESFELFQKVLDFMFGIKTIKL